MTPDRLRVEPRWPPLLAVVGLLGVLAVMPSRVRLLPPWVPWVIGAGLVAPMAGFTAFTAAAAFSPADALPLTPRAKLLMLAESAVSLATLVVVASRAIGLLGAEEARSRRLP